MDFPQIFVFDGADESAAASELRDVVHGLGEEPFVVTSQRGATLAEYLGSGERVTPPPGAAKEWASKLGRKIRRSGAKLVVAIGGGRALDLGKLAAARAGAVILTVPTQLSHDGLCSPVAVVPIGGGKTDSLGVVAPKGVFLSLPTLVEAPVESVRAGVGDLLANPLALRDWALAAGRGLAEIDRRAWDMSVESFALIEPHLDSDIAGRARDPVFQRTLADALVLSGMAMIQAGTSRPASGAEHEISHAIDQIYGGRAMHGAQVAFGCIMSVALYGEDTAAFRARLRRLGLPDHPEMLGLDYDDMTRVLLTAPDTRPGRFTVLEDAALEEKGARRLVHDTWAERGA